MGFGVPDPTSTGSIVAILVQQAIRRNNVGKLRGMKNGYAAPQVFIGAIPVSVKAQETFKLSSEVTQHAIESGALVHDHIILQPIVVDVVFEVTNFDAAWPKYTNDLFVDLWRSRTPIDLLTETGILHNMVMKDYSADMAVPEWGALKCRATFQQITTVTPDKVNLPDRVKPTPKTGGPTKPKAAEAPKPNVSVAKQLANFSFSALGLGG